MSSRMNYIAYGEKDRIVWGIGYSVNDALDDAGHWVYDWNRQFEDNSDPLWVDVSTVQSIEATEEVISAVKDNGGDEVSWEIVEGKATLKP